MSNVLFGAQDVELLKKHLQAVVEVEFFTVPFYLTAVYSFTQKALSYKVASSSPLYTLQQEALSVAVQEMYHLQLACNLANAFDVAPTIPQLSLTAGQEIKIPHLADEQGQPLTGQLGNLPAAIKAMIEIEQPDPDPDFPPPNEQVEYHSISDLYHATLTLLGQYLQAYAMVPQSADPHFDPQNQIAYATFASTYNYNEITDRPDVADVINAITDQGEGKIVAPPAPTASSNTDAGDSANAGDSTVARVTAAKAMLSTFFSFSTEDDQVQQRFQPKAGTRFAEFGALTHYARFKQIGTELGDAQQWTEKIGGSAFYPDGDPSSDLPAWAAGISQETIQSSVNTLWSYLTDYIQTGFRSGHLPPESGDPSIPGFNDAMLSFKYTLPLLWQWGTCPSFEYRAGVTPAEVQAAMDAVDPLCLFHWDAITAQLRADPTFPQNVCQGLNECAGKGWGGVATAKGNGACATVDLHTCGGNNTCKGQGGCGFLVSKGGEACGPPPALATASASCQVLCGTSCPDLLPPSEEWIPGQNICGQRGGCQTPIATEQAFNSSAGQSIDCQNQQQKPEWTPEAKQQLKDLMGKSVWDRARQLFAQKEGISDLPTPAAGTKPDSQIDYDGDKRRAAIQPTSK